MTDNDDDDDDQSSEASNSTVKDEDLRQTAHNANEERTVHKK